MASNIVSGNDYSIHLTNLNSGFTGSNDIRSKLFDDDAVQFDYTTCSSTNCAVNTFTAGFTGVAYLQLWQENNNGGPTNYNYTLQITNP